MSTTTIVSNSATILQESGRLVLTILSSNTAAGVLAEKTQQALDGISSAADTAMFTAGMQPDTATGLFNTVSGEYFNVPSGDIDEFAILYKNAAGVAVEQKRFPGHAILQSTLAAATASEASAVISQAAADFAFDTVQGIADVSIYGTKAEATAAVASLPDLAIVQVLVDESLAGIKSLYRKESGTLVFKLQLLTKAAVDAAVFVARNIYDADMSSAGISVGESSSIGATWDYTHVNTTGFISSNVTRNGGWLAAADTLQYLDVNLPFGVIIGDSIAEGHGSPDRHGRLHTGTTPIYNLAALNVAGQPAYHLAEKTGMYWFNHGIGGQTSAQVWARWARDVLAQTVAVGDGRPDTTLDAKPFCVWVNVGINDISTAVDVSVTKQNLLSMAQSARANGIICGFNTVGPNNTHTAGQIQQQKDLSQWMKETLPLYGAYIFDFRKWFDNPATPDTVNPQLASDSVHPRGAGYLSYVSALLKQTAAPIVLEKICVESKVDPDSAPTLYASLKGLRVLHVALDVDYVATLENNECYIPSGFDMTNTRFLRFYPCETSAFPVSGSNRVGISRVYGCFGTKKQSLNGSRSAGCMLKSVSGAYSIESTYPRVNVIDVTVISTTHLRVRFTRPVKFARVTAQGSNRLYDFSVAVTTSPNREIVVYVIDKATGSTINPATATGTFFFSINAE